jgi:branched-chain amino acid transport system substrate-binding protein
VRMTSARWLILVLVASWTSVPSAVRAADKAKVLIGATLPLTGSEARVGGFFKEGYELAFEEVNKAGGLDVGGKKLPVQLILQDDTSTQATAVSLADRLVNNDRVDFLLGTYSSHLVEAQSTVAEQNRIPYLNGGGGATKIYTRKFKYIFGLLSPVELLGSTLMTWADEQQKGGKLPKPSKVALVWENTAHGKDFRKGVSDHAKKTGGAYQIAVDESFELNGKDFGALLGKVKAANVDLLLVDAHLPDYITMHRQYVGSGMCNKVVSYGARGTEKDAVQALGLANVTGVLSGVWWSAQLASTSPRSKAFVELFKAKYGGRAPEWYQALGYESARILFAAIQKAGSTDREAVRKVLAETKFESLLPGGTVEFKQEFGQQVQNPFVIQQNQPDGSAPIIYPHDVASAGGIAVNPRCAK